ncbi:MAG: hypothetical protein JNJ65_08240 [Cyclobacteriaceae bacterium]|jgi:hypothetical protein|nr:hypothetical protein [Cyclobacteriaceae bacterium]
MLLRFYRAVNLLSLDVAGGAVVVALYFSKVLQVEPRFQGILALGLAVWIIYTVDRLLDVRRMEMPASTKRHRFHQQHHRTLWIITLLATGIVLSLIFFLRPPVLLYGFVLGTLVGIYLLIQNRLPWKEIMVALLYTAGVLFPSSTVQVVTLSVDQVFAIFFTFLIALINLLLFSWFELESDQQDRRLSFVTRWGKRKAERILFTLFLATGTMATGMFIVFRSPMWIPLMIMIAILFIIFYYPDYFRGDDRYRLWGDSVFLLPMLEVMR